MFGRRIETALVDPHGGQDRFDPEFMLALQCLTCGKIGQARRKDVREAIRDHIERKHTTDDEAVHVRVLYPKQ